MTIGILHNKVILPLAWPISILCVPKHITLKGLNVIVFIVIALYTTGESFRKFKQRNWISNDIIIIFLSKLCDIETLK